MLSIETEARVVKLFINLFEGEKSVEYARENLANQREFDAYQSFQRIDREKKNYVDEYNIVDFLKNNSVYATAAEARIIISFYDSNYDGNLNYTEFLNMILSDSNYSIRRLARDRIGYRTGFTLPYDVELSLTRILERELELARAVELLVADIKARYDFNILDIYTLIQGYGNFISNESVRKFFLRNGIDVIESEVRATFKRLDIDRDSRVTFSEFKRLFTSSVPSSANNSNGFGKNSTFYDSKSSLSNSKGLSESPVRSPLRSTLRSPVRASATRFYSPNRYSSPLRDRTLNVLEMSNERINRSLRKSPEPLRNSSTLLNASSSSGFKSSNLGSSRLVSGSNYVTFEEENFISYVKELLDLENQIEKAKCDMIIKSDFNAEDAFGIFEIDRRGYITDLDIKYGLNSLDIFPTHEEIALVIKRHDSRGEGILTYNDFFDMICPVDLDFKRMLENRLPSIYGSRRYRTDVFLTSTRMCFQDFLRLVISAEARIEVLRQRLNRLTRFSVRTIFEKFDRLGKGWIIDTDFTNYLRRNDVRYNLIDVDFFFNRYDRDRDGRIIYSEFYDELYPKSKEYFN